MAPGAIAKSKPASDSMQKGTTRDLTESIIRWPSDPSPEDGGGARVFGPAGRRPRAAIPLGASDHLKGHTEALESLAIARPVQWVASPGGSAQVIATTRATVSAGNGGVPGGRVLSCSRP